MNMKDGKNRVLPLVYRAICLVFLAGIFLMPVQAGEDARFQVKADGTVHIDGHVFKNMAQYLHSDYFKQAGKRCGTDRRRQENPREVPPLGSQNDCTTSITVIQNEYYPSVTYTVPIVFHVITHGNGTTGNVSDQRIDDQIQALNEDFGAIAGTMGANGYNSKIQFTLAGITRTANTTWYNDNGELTYKGNLGWDQDRYLNVYTNTADGNLGYAYLPQEHAGTTRDGVVMLHNTIGGRNNGYQEFDQGRTLVHEVGHYLGLDHTFAGDGWRLRLTAPHRCCRPFPRVLLWMHGETFSTGYLEPGSWGIFSCFFGINPNSC